MASGEGVNPSNAAWASASSRCSGRNTGWRPTEVSSSAQIAILQDATGFSRRQQIFTWDEAVTWFPFLGVRRAAGHLQILLATRSEQVYSNSMASSESTQSSIGDTRPILVPTVLKGRQGLEPGMHISNMEKQKAQGSHENSCKLSWAETAREMVKINEDWSDMELAACDGLDQIPWITDRIESSKSTSKRP